MCVFVQKLNLFDKGWFEKITFTSFAEQFLNICFSFSNHHYISTICKISSRYVKYLQDMQNIFKLCKILQQCAKYFQSSLYLHNMQKYLHNMQKYLHNMQK